MIGHNELPLRTVTQLDNRAQDLGNDVAGLAQYHGVSDEDSLALDLEGVVEGGHLDSRSRNGHRPHDPVRRDAARSSDIDTNVEKFGIDLLRRVLVRDGPPGSSRSCTKLALQRDIIDLDHHTVDLVGGLITRLSPGSDELMHLLGVLDDLEVRRHRQAPFGELVVRVSLAGKLMSFNGANPVNDHRQGT